MNETDISLESDSSSVINKTLPYIALCFAVVFWAGSFVGMRIALKELTPMQVTWLRMLVAFLVLAPFMHRLRKLMYTRKNLLYIGITVLFLPCLYYLFEANALKYTTSSQAGVISSVVPLLVAFLGWIFLKERFGFKTGFGLVISIFGVIWLTVSGSDDGKAANAVLGNSMEFIAMTCAGVSMVILKNLSCKYSPFDLTIFQVIAGFIFFLPGGYSLLKSDMSLSINVLLAVVFLGVFVTIGAFGLYNWAMSRMSAAGAAVYINLVPVVAVVFGWIILDESLSFMQIIAGFLILFGVWLSSRK